MSASDSPTALHRPGLAEDERPFNLGTFQRHHGTWLIALLRRRFTSQDAEDLAQDAYVRALDGSVQVRNPRAFLAQVARRSAIDQARQDAAESTAVTEHLRRENLSVHADETDALALKQAVLALPPKLREVFLLSRFVGLTYAEIANRCGVSVDTVKERLTKAQTMCSALMRD
jgi:RNA polymerase sigma-70 factor (ECF subfamily)